MAHEKVDPMSITRPIKIKRDFDGAKKVVKRLKSAPKGDSAAELRLQSLLKEMDRFEEVNDADDETSEAADYAGPARRWSDDGADDRS